jgi:uncharacterized protein YndB with AHSA1/START domain
MQTYTRGFWSHARWQVVSLGLCMVACQSPDAVGGLSAAETAAPAGKQLALGKAHGCSLDAAISGVLCWGDNRHGQATVPTLVTPSFVAAGGDVTCAIDTGIVRCWGDASHGQLRVPVGLLGATDLTVGDTHACAASGDRVSCWGDSSSDQLHVPALSGVRSIVAGAKHTCALTDKGVTCWGDNAQNQLKVPTLREPSQLAVGGNHSCVIDDNKVVCWGGDSQNLREKLPEITNPRVLATSETHSCVLDSQGVKCWGDSTNGDLTPPELTNTVQLATGGGAGFACARHLQGVTCWGDNSVGQTKYDGGELHILHHSESLINAPSERVWQVIMDLDRYPDWNPYTIAMKSTLQIGAAMDMTVKMNDLITLDQTEYIRVLEQGHKVCWGINTDTPEFNSGERCQWLTPVDSGGTHYVTEDLIEGTANPLVTALFGNDVQVGFDAVAVALKKRAEQLEHP